MAWKPIFSNPSLPAPVGFNTIQRRIVGYTRPELRATWARFQWNIDGVPVTQVMDYRDRSVRDAVYLPLYPLAEWLASHWWSLLFEVPTPHRLREANYDHRHNLRYAREGFALPHVRIVPQGESTTLEWRQDDLRDYGVRFLTDVASNGRHSPAFLIEKQQTDSRKFAYCRALFEYLASESNSPALVTRAHSQRQKRSRAFAAEFLVPSATLRQRVPGETISEYGIVELAEEFRVSEYVVRHQIENHGIADVIAER